jgi:hypothetical protein
VSAKTTAQNPAGSVMPPLSLAQAALLLEAADAFDVSDALLFSPLQATNPTSAMLLIKRYGCICSLTKRVNADTELCGR